MANNRSEFSIIIRPIAVILLVIFAIGLIGYFTLGHDDEVIQGEVEVTEYRVSGKVPGRILRYYVEEGDKVHAGDTLAQLDAPEVAAKMDQAQAATSAAEAVNAKTRKGTRQEQLQSAQQLWNQAKTALTVSQKTYDRMKRLYDEGVIPAQRLDEITAQRDAAIAQEKLAHSQYQMAVNGAQEEDKAMAEAMVEKAQGAVNEVKAYIKETILTASADGEVSEIFPKVGELVGTGSPIMNIAQTDHKWVTFNVREDLLKDIKVNARVIAFVPALDSREIELTVYHIKDLGTYAAWKATKSTGQYDLKTFEVKARPTADIDGLRAGMTVVLKR